MNNLVEELKINCKIKAEQDYLEELYDIYENIKETKVTAENKNETLQKSQNSNDEDEKLNKCNANQKLKINKKNTLL